MNYINFSLDREALQKKKEELHAEKHKSRLDRRITFDFAGRKVVEEEGAPHYDFEQVCNQFEDVPTRLDIDFSFAGHQVVGVVQGRRLLSCLRDQEKSRGRDYCQS